jgi:subtilisin family serine protease
MRQSTIIFLSFILSAQSVMSAYAASSTIMADDTIVIEQNSSPISLPQQRPVPQPAPQPVTQAQSTTPEKPKPSEKKTASKKSEKKTASKKQNKKQKQQKQSKKPAPQEVSSDLPYYVLGGLAVGGIVALAAGGGGGGGGGGGSDTNTIDFAAEAQRNYGLTNIQSFPAYARGATGQNATVAVIDSGFDTTHPDLAGNMLTGIDVVDNDGNVNNNYDGDYHGNWVSGVVASVRNGVGTHGVAYDAKILPIRAGDADGFSYVDLASAVDVARNRPDVDVINLSLGSQDTLSGTNPLTGTGTVYYDTPISKAATFWNIGTVGQAYATALANAEAAGKVVVFAAGNEGFNAATGTIYYFSSATERTQATFLGTATYNQFLASTGVSSANYAANQSTFDARLPEIIGSPVTTGTWLNVVATDQNNVIADFSNGCGDTQNFCLAAPGVDIVTTGNNGSYQTVSGTSFAAPHVSGAVAVLMSAFPNLTPEQVVTLLLTTATDLGDAGVDDVYGRGLVNLDEATKPQGTTSVASASGLTAPVPSGLLSSAFGDSLQAGNVAFLDGYGRVYNAPVKTLVDDMNPADLTDKFGALWQSASAFASRDDRGQAGSIYNWSASSDNRDDTVGMAVSSLGYVKGGGISPLFSYQSSDTVRAGFAMNPAVYANQDVNRMQISVPVSEASALRVGSAFSKNYSAEGTVPLVNDNKTMGYDLEYAQRIADDVDVAAFTGVMREKGQVLGSLFNGAFAVEDTNTTFAGVSATYSLAPSTFLTGSYMYATSDASTQNQAFSMQDLSSDSTMLGLVSTDVASTGDAAMVSLRQPLRNRSGSGSLSSISGYTDDGGYASRTTNYDLTPSGREQTLEFAYSTPVGEAQSVTFTLGGSQDYANVAGQEEAHALAVYRLTW